MSKILYDPITNQRLSYPRNDDLDIIGLSGNLIVLDKIDTPQPEYDPETHSISSRYVIDLELNQYRQEWIVEAISEVIVPRWDDFNLVFCSLPSLLQAELIANQNHPSIVSKKDLAYSMVDDHGTGTLSYIFPLFCQAGQVDSATRFEWAELAESFNMPQDFVDIIRG